MDIYLHSVAYLILTNHIEVICDITTAYGTNQSDAYVLGTGDMDLNLYHDIFRYLL